MEQSTTPIQLIQLVRYKYFQVKLQIFSRLPLKNCPATRAEVIYSDGTKSPSSGALLCAAVMLRLQSEIHILMLTCRPR